MRRVQLVRCMLSTLKVVKLRPGEPVTAEQLIEAIGLAHRLDLRRLVRATKWTVEVRGVSNAVAGLSRGAHAGRIWLRGYSTLLPMRGNEPTVRRLISVEAAIVDTRYTGPHCAHVLELQAAKNTARQLNRARYGNLEEFLALLTA